MKGFCSDLLDILFQINFKGKRSIDVSLVPKDDEIPELDITYQLGEYFTHIKII